MVARLPSLELAFEFHNQIYSLSQEISSNCRIITTRDVLIREGKIELVCEETWREFFTITVPISGGAPRLRGEAYVRSPSRTKRVTEKQREVFTHSSKRFLEMKELSGSSTYEFFPILPIENIKPLHADLGEIRWKLLLTIVTGDDGQFRVSKEIFVNLEKNHHPL